MWLRLRLPRTYTCQRRHACHARPPRHLPFAALAHPLEQMRPRWLVFAASLLDGGLVYSLFKLPTIVRRAVRALPLPLRGKWQGVVSHGSAPPPPIPAPCQVMSRMADQHDKAQRLLWGGAMPLTAEAAAAAGLTYAQFKKLVAR